MTKYNTRHWSRALTHMIARADQQDVRTLGITATQTGAGVSLLAHAVIESYVGFGRKTLLAHSKQEPTSKVGQTISLLEVLDTDIQLDQARGHFNDLTTQFDITVVDLPPVSEAPGRTTPEFMRFAPLCDMIFLICLTNMTTKEELTDCVEQCAIHKLNLGGIIMNDFRLVGSRLISA